MSEGRNKFHLTNLRSFSPPSPSPWPDVAPVGGSFFGPLLLKLTEKVGRSLEASSGGPCMALN